MRSWPRSTVRLRVRADGLVMNLYRLEKAASDEIEFVGYWTSVGIGRVADPWRQFVWLVLGRVPRSYYAVRSGPMIPPEPPRPENGSGVREPRRPMPPSRSSAVALPLPGGE